jgi:hypothetical protein
LPYPSPPLHVFQFHVTVVPGDTVMLAGVKLLLVTATVLAGGGGGGGGGGDPPSVPVAEPPPQPNVTTMPMSMNAHRPMLA